MPQPLGLACFLLLGLLLGVVALIARTAYLLTHPPRRTYADALARNRPGDPGELPGPPRAWSLWHFQHRGLALPVWDITGDHPDGPVLILSHGWGDSRVGGLSRVPSLLPLASRILLWDMPGHGEAPGTCALGVREPAALADLVRAASPERPFILLGWSLGAGVCIAAAAEGLPAAAVVAEAPYRHAATPARNMLAALGLPYRANLPPALWILGAALGIGPRWLGFDRADLAARLACPLLVIHGEADDICPPADGLAIAAAATRGSFTPIPAAGHYGLWTDPALAAACDAALRRFLTDTLPPR